MNELYQVLRLVNPFYHSFKKMIDVEKEQEEKAKRLGLKIPKVALCIKKYTGDDPRRYNLPRVGEISVVFTDEDGNPPENRDFMIYPKSHTNENNLTTLSFLSQNTDPMTYPLLFPNGDFGWRVGLEHEDNYK